MAIAILILLCFLVFFFLFYIFNSCFGGLDFSTSPLAASKIIEIIKSRHLERGNFVDLGSCRGKFAVKIAKGLPNLRIIGIDDSWLRTIIAKTRSVFYKNLFFKKGNIFKENLSAADIVYIYLPEDLMAGLQNKMQKELRPKSLVITHRVSFPSWQLIESFILHSETPGFEKLFMYQKM